MLREAFAISAEDMTLFPKKDDPLVRSSIKIQQSLLEQIDWIAQREGRSRSEVFETAARHLVESYEREIGKPVGRIALTEEKQHHRRSPKRKQQ